VDDEALEYIYVAPLTYSTEVLVESFSAITFC